MSDVEELKRNAVLMFGNIVRTSSLSATANHQQIQMVLMQWLGGLEPPAPMDMAPLYEWMKGEGYPLDGVNEVLYFLKTREERLGFSLTLPVEIENLSPGAKERIVQAFAKRPAGGTYSGNPQRPGEAAPAAAPANSYDDIVKRKKNPMSGRGRIIGLVSAGVLAAGAILALPLLDEKVAAVTPIPTTLTPNALPCVALEAGGSYAVCRIPTKVWEDLLPDVRERKLDASREELKAMGYVTLVVRSSEDGTILKVR